MAELHDLDINGRELVNGTPYVLDEYESIEQGLKLYLSYQNDRLYYPEYKGVLKRLAFKQMNDRTLTPMKFDIQTDILNGFIPNITINQLDLVPDEQNKIMELKLSYTVNSTRKTNSAIFYVRNNNIVSTEKFNYQNIEYTDENLYNWVNSTRFNPEVQNKKLIYNYDENCWTWGRYRLNNLTDIDSYFSAILSLINT